MIVEKPLITVIVPVFNVELYLDKCIESIINQTYQNLEILLIDDGSTDRSSIICDHWANIDSRIRVIHKNNAGLSSARNCGLDFCHGDYIAFLDSDDWLHKDCYLNVLSVALDNNSDITCYDIFECYNSGKRVVNHLPLNVQGSVPALGILDKLFNVWPLVWAKLYKTSWLKKHNIRFINGTLYEDNPFVFACWIRNPRVSFVYSPLHYYRMERPGQITSTGNPNTIDVFYMMDCVWGDFKRNFQERKYISLIDWSVGNIIWLYNKTPEQLKPLFKRKMRKQFATYIVLCVRYMKPIKISTLMLMIKNYF